MKGDARGKLLRGECVMRAKKDIKRGRPTGRERIPHLGVMDES